jgi:hypothetical protein
LCLVAGKKGKENWFMSTPMSGKIPLMPEGSPVIVPLNIIVGFLLMFIVAIRIL